MTLIFLVAVAVVSSLLLIFFAVIEDTILRLSRMTLRVLAEKNTSPRLKLLENLAGDRRQFLLPVQIGILGLITVLVVSVVLIGERLGLPAAILIALSFVLLIGLRQVVPRLITRRDPERILISLLPIWTLIHLPLKTVSYPLVILLRSPISAKNDDMDVDEEASDEEIQAYLGVGEEEGIFEGDETDLIQSALEFQSTLVREIMTPRNEIVAIDESASLGELRDLIVSSKHSRIPVYRQRLDQIMGVVYVRNLLGHLSAGKEEDPITPLLSEALVVPETKKVAELLKEMQARAEHIAIVINEYGAVSGLVTIEDVLEEIVGEIHDEDELLEIFIEPRGDGSYVVSGSTEIDVLEEALNIDLGDHDVTTVSGLIVGHLGKVPEQGESVSLESFDAEILNADERRIRSLRLFPAQPRVDEETKPASEH